MVFGLFGKGGGSGAPADKIGSLHQMAVVWGMELSQDRALGVIHMLITISLKEQIEASYFSDASLGEDHQDPAKILAMAQPCLAKSVDGGDAFAVVAHDEIKVLVAGLLNSFLVEIDPSLLQEADIVFGDEDKIAVAKVDQQPVLLAATPRFSLAISPKCVSIHS